MTTVLFTLINFNCAMPTSPGYIPPMVRGGGCEGDGGCGG